MRITALGGHYDGSSFVQGGQAFTIPENYATAFYLPGEYGFPFETIPEMQTYFWDQLNAVIDDWWQTPYSQHFDEQIALAQSQAHAFAYGGGGESNAPAGPGVEHFGPNENLSDIQTIQNRVSNLNGAAILEFESYFSNKIDEVVNAQGAAACVVWGCAIGEKEAWARSQQSRVNTALAARNAMRACYGAGGADMGALVNVVGAVASVAGAVMTGGLGVALGIAGTTISLAGGFVPPPEESRTVELGAETPEGVFSNMKTALKETSDKLREEEGWIRDACRAAAAAVALDKNRLGTPALVNETDPGRLYAEDEIVANYDTIKTVATTYMPAIASEISSAGSMMGELSGGWDRSSGIGLGSVGAFNEWQALIEAIREAASETALSVNQAAEALVIVGENFKATDAEVLADMQALAAKTEQQNAAAGF